MKRSALALVVCVLFAPVTFAQQDAAEAPATKADVEKYLETLHIRELMKIRVAGMTKQVHELTHEAVEKQPGLPSDFEARMDKILDDMMKDYPVDELIDVMIPVYQKHLTKGEVDAMVAFYSTPTGQKILKEMPAMTTEAMEASTGPMRKMMSKMMDRVQEEIAQMLKENGEGPKKQQATQN